MAAEGAVAASSAASADPQQSSTDAPAAAAAAAATTTTASAAAATTTAAAASSSSSSSTTPASTTATAATPPSTLTLCESCHGTVCQRGKPEDACEVCELRSTTASQKARIEELEAQLSASAATGTPGGRSAAATARGGAGASGAGAAATAAAGGANATGKAAVEREGDARPHVMLIGDSQLVKMRRPPHSMADYLGSRTPRMLPRWQAGQGLDGMLAYLLTGLDGDKAEGRKFHVLWFGGLHDTTLEDYDRSKYVGKLQDALQKVREHPRVLSVSWATLPESAHNAEAGHINEKVVSWATATAADAGGDDTATAPAAASTWLKVLDLRYISRREGTMETTEAMWTPKGSQCVCESLKKFLVEKLEYSEDELKALETSAKRNKEIREIKEKRKLNKRGGGQAKANGQPAGQQQQQQQQPAGQQAQQKQQQQQQAQQQKQQQQQQQQQQPQQQQQQQQPAAKAGAAQAAKKAPPVKGNVNAQKYPPVQIKSKVGPPNKQQKGPKGQPGGQPKIVGGGPPLAAAGAGGGGRAMVNNPIMRGNPPKRPFPKSNAPTMWTSGMPVQQQQQQQQQLQHPQQQQQQQKRLNGTQAKRARQDNNGGGGVYGQSAQMGWNGPSMGGGQGGYGGGGGGGRASQGGGGGGLGGYGHSALSQGYNQSPAQGQMYSQGGYNKYHGATNGSYGGGGTGYSSGDAYNQNVYF